MLMPPIATYNDQSDAWLNGRYDRLATNPQAAGPVAIRLRPSAP